MFFLKKIVECQSLSQGRTKNFLIGVAQLGARQRRQIRNADPLPNPLDYIQNKLNNARTTQEYNNNDITSCIVEVNKVMNDRCKIE